MSETDYDKGRQAIEALAPLVSKHGGGKEFAVLVDMVDALKPQKDQVHPLPYALTGKRARSALVTLTVRFRKAVGINVFDRSSEELVRATWALVHAVVADKFDELSELYRNTGADHTPDLDVVTELKSSTEIPEVLGDLLWGVQSRRRSS